MMRLRSNWTQGAGRRIGAWPLLLSGLLFLSHVACDPTLGRIQQDHVLNRMGYGPDPWSRARIQALGVNGYIDEQLHPETLDDSALEAQIAALYPVTTMPFGQSRTTFHEYTGNPEIGPGTPIRDATRAKILRAVKSKKQLEQVLVDFWYNHFNVDAIIEEARWGFVTLERDAIRPHVLGRFEDMLRATTQNPGMLDYLDNAVNFRTGYVHLGIPYGINENYAREFLELHTVGVDGGYTQDDVREVARAFTAWTISTFFQPTSTGFQYLNQGHDQDPKNMMGLALAANGGQNDGRDVVAHFAALPQTAYFLSEKLCRRFIADDPPAAVVQAAATTYLSTGGDLREVMRTILRSAEFLSIADRNTRVKRPFVYAASLARAVGVADDATFAATLGGSTIQILGETPYRAGPPTGYPDVSGAWTGEGTVIARINLAWRAAHGEAGFGPIFQVTGTTPAEIVDQLQKQFLRNGIEPSTRAALESLVAGLPPAARVQQAAATLLASPDFLMH
jgi:uncharacterized protein (DUF1800 family)